jgi:hypothetical protein
MTDYSETMNGSLPSVEQRISVWNWAVPVGPVASLGGGEVLGLEAGQFGGDRVERRPVVALVFVAGDEVDVGSVPKATGRGSRIIEGGTDHALLCMARATLMPTAFATGGGNAFPTWRYACVFRPENFHSGGNP